ncbi:hypothetical protein ES332_D13G219600v1 [Gossypium tomentosum]|uniref:CCHC-type domain-containing protein n=1 Tax=Gossypium tomentosum TaxID=34277 RepID=A0A5D2I028_GOSTO|nr:hypothetical protein ES332_D13G219600v1 [Gossypium tomentosum]
MNVQTRPYYQGHNKGGFRPRGSGRYSNNSRFQCQLCGKTGHLVSKCFHRFDDSFTGIFDSIATNSQFSNYVKPSEGVNGFYCYPGPTTGFTMFSPQVGHPGFTGLNTQGNFTVSRGLNVSAHIPSTGMPPAHAGTSHIAAYNCSMPVVSNLNAANPYVMSYNNGNPFASGASSLCPRSTQAVSEGNWISQCVQATSAVVTDPAWYPDTGATRCLTHDSTFLPHSNAATGCSGIRS